MDGRGHAGRHEKQGFNRDVLECIHTLWVRDKVGPGQIADLLKLLKARDEEVRILVADDLGTFKAKNTEGALVQALKDPAPQVRRFALRSLLRLESRQGLPAARALAANDPSEDVRRTAVVYLGRVRDKTDVFPALAAVLEKDASSPVRTAAVEALTAMEEPRAEGAFTALAQTDDIYVRRAVGKALAELGRTKGIAVLIGTLSFPSIDAFYNYDRNIPNFLAAYTGHDLPEEERYDRARWQEWFDKNKDAIDLKANVAAYRAYTKLADTLDALPREKQIEELEALVAKYPRNARAAKVLAGKLNEAAWGLVTAPAGSPDLDVDKGLRYALRAVELDPLPGIVDTLAEAYMVKGDFEAAEKVCLDVLEKSPDDKMFADRLERVRREKKEGARGASP